MAGGSGWHPRINETKATRERLTLIRVFEELRDLGYEGGYDAVRRYARGWRQHRNAWMTEVTSDGYCCPTDAPIESRRTIL